jgi:hypothetical protein
MEILTSPNALINAARALAISAYPQSMHLQKGGKAEKYADALLAYMVRVALWNGKVDRLFDWARDIKAEDMRERLRAGHRQLIRHLCVREIIASALSNRVLTRSFRENGAIAFQIKYAPDFSTMAFQFTTRRTDDGLVLGGGSPKPQLKSLREAIRYHAPALMKFEGPSPRLEGTDEEARYQNAMNRLIRPALRTWHIRQVVWEAATELLQESDDREIPIDQLLVRQPEWATQIHQESEKRVPMLLLVIQELGLSIKPVELVRLAAPMRDS